MSRNREYDQAVREIASRTGNVAADRQLRAVGVPSSYVRRRCHDGDAARLFPSVTAFGPQCHNPTADMVQHAAVLQAGDGASLEGAAGAAAIDLWNRKVHSVHVASPNRVRHVGRQIVFRHAPTRWDSTILRSASNCPVSGVMDLCVGMSMTHNAWQVAFVIRRAQYFELVDLQALKGVVAMRRGERGNAVLRHAIDLVEATSNGTRSTSEDAFLEDMLAEGVEEPEVNVRGALGISRDEPDFVFRRGVRAYNIEMDGGHHDHEPQRSDDERRDRELAALGVPVLRVTTRLFWKHRRRTVQRCVHFLNGGHVDLEPGTRRLML